MKNQNKIIKKYKNRIYYLLNREKINKNYNRVGMCRYRNAPFIGKINIEKGNFIVYFD